VCAIIIKIYLLYVYRKPLLENLKKNKKTQEVATPGSLNFSAENINNKKNPADYILLYETKK